MKATKKLIKSMALVLSILILFQGCTVYKSASVTLEQAVQKKKKAQITTLDNHTMHFKKIVFKDGKYFGVKKLNDNSKDIRLFENDIKKLKIENKTMTIVLSTLPITIPLIYIGMGYLLYPNTFGFPY